MRSSVHSAGTLDDFPRHTSTGVIVGVCGCSAGDSLGGTPADDRATSATALGETPTCMAILLIALASDSEDATAAGREPTGLHRLGEQTLEKGAFLTAHDTSGETFSAARLLGGWKPKRPPGDGVLARPTGGDGCLSAEANDVLGDWAREGATGREGLRVRGTFVEGLRASATRGCEECRASRLPDGAAAGGSACTTTLPSARHGLGTCEADIRHRSSAAVGLCSAERARHEVT